MNNYNCRLANLAEGHLMPKLWRGIKRFEKKCLPKNDKFLICLKNVQMVRILFHQVTEWRHQKRPKLSNLKMNSKNALLAQENLDPRHMTDMLNGVWKKQEEFLILQKKDLEALAKLQTRVTYRPKTPIRKGSAESGSPSRKASNTSV